MKCSNLDRSEREDLTIRLVLSTVVSLYYSEYYIKISYTGITLMIRVPEEQQGVDSQVAWRHQQEDKKRGGEGARDEYSFRKGTHFFCEHFALDAQISLAQGTSA